MLRSAMLTTVPSSIAMPGAEHRGGEHPAALRVPAAMPGRGHAVPVRLRDQPGVAHLGRVRRPGAGRRSPVAAPAEVLVEPAGPVVLLQAPQLRDRRTPLVHARAAPSRSRSSPARSPHWSGCTARCRSERSSYAANRSIPAVLGVPDEYVDPGLVEHQRPAGQHVVVGEREPVRREHVAQPGEVGGAFEVPEGGQVVERRLAEHAPMLAPLRPAHASRRPAAKVRLDCLFVGGHDGRVSTDRPRAAGGAHPRHARSGCSRRPSSAWSSAASRDVDHAGLPAGRRQPRARSCTTSRPRTTWWSPPSSTSPTRGASRAARPPRRELPTGPRRTRAVARDARRPLHRPGLHRRARAVGRGPHRRGAARRRRPARAAGRPRDAPARPSSCSASTSREPGVRELVQATLDLVRGLGLANTITDDAAPPRAGSSTSGPTRPRRRAQEAAHERPCWRRCSPTSRPRATGSSDLVAGLDDAGLAHADPGRRLGRRHPGRPPGLDRRGRRRRGHRQGRPGTTSCSRRIADPDGLRRRRGARAARRLPPAELLARWRRGRGRRSPRRCARCREGEKMPWFGPPMCADLDGHRAVHGDLGALARRRRGPRRRRRDADRPDPPRRPPRRAHPRLRLRRRTGSTPPAEEFRVDLVAPSGESWAWGPADAAQSVHRLGVRLLPAGHPAACTATTPTWSPPARTPTAWLDIAQAFAGPPATGRSPW